MTPNGNVSETRDATPKLVGFLQEKKNLLMIVGAVVVVAVIGLSNAGSPTQPRKVATTTPEQKPVTPEQAGKFVDELKKETDALAEQAAREHNKAAEVQQALAQQQNQAAAGYGTSGFQNPVQYAPAPPPTAKDDDSNIAVSFRNGMQTPQPAAPANTNESALADIRNLIEAQKAALAANIAASTPAMKPAIPAPATIQSLPPVSEKKSTEDPELHAAVGKTYKVFEGTYIESVLTNRLNGTFTGPVDVLVSSPLYSHDHEHVLIPQGSRIIGEAQKVGQQGQQRLAVVFHRLLMPDGFSVDLDKFVGLNQIGEAGLKDQINHHYAQVFGVSVALGLVSGFSQFGTGSALTTGGFGQYRQGVASSIGQSNTQVLDQFLNVLPTITIRAGHRVRVFISQDLDLPAFENHRVSGDV